MPAISAIRFTQVIYENGNKRYNNETFHFHGHNGAIVLENGGGKTVFIQTAIQAVIPHADLAGRKLKDTLQLESGPAHIAIEWILADKPRRRYAVTCVTLHQSGNGIDSIRYVYEYGEHDSHSLDNIPFVKENMGKLRPADRGEMQDYYSSMEQRYPLQAKTFATIKEYRAYLDKQLHIIAGEWDAIVKINETEGGIEKFFDECKSTTQLFDRLLIPTVELSIEGYEQGAFAGMFEARREEFKRYKELKEQIEENKRILQELGQYVKLSERMDAALLDYDESRSKAKAYWQLSRLHHDELQSERNALLRQEEDWRQRGYIHARQSKSLGIMRERQECGALETAWQLAADAADEAQEGLRLAEKQYYSVQYAEYREKGRQAAARCKGLEEQLAALSRSEDEEELERQWVLNGAQLRYRFMRTEAELQDRQSDYEEQLRLLQEGLSAAAQKLAQLDGLIREAERLVLQKEGQRQNKLEQMEHYTRVLLENPQLEKIETQIPVWSAEEQRLEQSRIAMLQELKRLEEERARLEISRKEGTEQLVVAERELTRLQHDEQQWRARHDELKQGLVSLRPAWERSGSLYERQSSMLEQLGETLAKLRQRKEKLLLKERLAFRFVDDHGEQEQFFADAAVAKLREQWSHQFALLQLGTDYVSQMTQEGEHGKALDRLWAVTLITTEREKPLLEGKLRQTSGSFSFPIRVLDAAEAANALMGGSDEARAASRDCWIVPRHWEGNEQGDLFRQWKAELAGQAELVSRERESAEAEIAQWDAASRSLSQFYEQYPLAAVQDMEQKLLVLGTSVSERTRELERLEHAQLTNRELMEQRRQSATEMEQRIMQLGMKLQDAQHYMLLAGEAAKLEQELQPERNQMQLMQGQRNREQARMEQLRRTEEQERHKLQEIRLQLQVGQLHPYYKEVLTLEPLSCETDMEELIELRRALDLQRHRILQERTQLERELAGERARASEHEGSMGNLLNEHPDLDTALPLPAETEASKKRLWSGVLDAREQGSRTMRERSEAERQLQAKQGAVDMLLRQFIEQFSGQEPDRFHEPLDKARQRLEEERLRLDKEASDRKRLQVRIDGQLQELERVSESWNRYALVHALEDHTLRAADLSAEVRSEFGYKRMQVTEQCVKELLDRRSRLDNEHNTLQKGRQRFKEFCMDHVKDIKLRQMTIQGLEAKGDHEEIKAFQQAMEQRIQMVIHIGEQSLLTHDKELQQFIQHLHAHLKLLVQELREIPKKTRVRTDDGWKEIYSFAVPQWEEQEGKERIRAYIDWIVNKLDHYSDEEGTLDPQELKARIRKDLEKWLDSRQLLQAVLKGEAMKVTCRKVTNEQQVTRASYSWEQSNRWSGGEKWSKNMTLFLGLLNYVAERKQYIQANMKRHRTVILDNPFGKASSEHVLSPVFFIAEQLGFQIVALTAHMEGKFLQDYFPIVYSCRLRHATDASKQIIETRQQVQSAYFRDQDPDTLDRISSKVTQIELF